MAAKNGFVTQNASAVTADQDVSARSVGAPVKKAAFSFEKAAGDINGSIFRVARISPWHWALGNTPLTSGFDLAVTGQFIGWYGICVVGGIAALNRRSIRTA